MTGARSEARRGPAGRTTFRAAALLCGLLACSCAPLPAVATFPWTDEAGSSLGFRQTRSWEAGSEASFGAERSANRYVLDRSLDLKAGQAIEVSVLRKSATSQTQPRISLGLYGPGRKPAAIASADFPLREAESRLVLVVDAEARLASISVEVAGESEKGGIEIRSISLRKAFRGLESIEGGVRVSSGFSMRLEGGKRILSLAQPFFPGQAGDAGQACIRLEYGPFTGQASAVIGPGAKPLRLRLRASGGSEILGSALFPPGAAGIELSLPERVPLRACFAASLPQAEAELADLGRVLLSAPLDPEADYSLYRWSVIPSVIVLDFRDYAAQDRYLKRLAFFVEKAGFRGRLAKDAEIAGLHGWNAHDYRSEDLAAFFEAARVRSFRLAAEELALESLLMERGLIVRKAGRISAGSGALISISRESVPYQRLTLLVHESTHAIFFSDGEYRDFVRSIWDGIPKDERWFWRLYFDWANYDVGSDYLMGNEFQAYLLQQPLARAEEYFTKLLPSRLVEKHPERQAPLDAYMARFGARFAENAALLDAWLARKYGLAAGRTWFLD